MIPMAGKTFGALRAVEPCRNMRAGWTWLCWCLTCGAIQDRLGSKLRSGLHDTCTSCGAKACPKRKTARAAEPGAWDLAAALGAYRAKGPHLSSAEQRLRKAAYPDYPRNANGRARKLAKAKRMEQRAERLKSQAASLRAEAERHAE